MYRWLLAGLALSLAACGDSSTGPATVDGSYVLSTIGGAKLPANVVLSTGTVQVTSGSLQLNTNKTFTETLSGSTVSGGGTVAVTLPSAGTYATNGTAIVLSYTAGGAVTGAWSGSSVTLVESGYTLVYAR